MGCNIVAILGLLFLPCVANAQELPNDVITPGVIVSTDIDEVCGRVNGKTYSKNHRVWTKQRETKRAYGIAENDTRPYQDDDRVPVCLGGDNADPKNHWMQPGFGTWTYQMKDQLDDEACRLACSHKKSLSELQAGFQGDWRKFYCDIFPDNTKCELLSENK